MSDLLPILHPLLTNMPEVCCSV